MKSTIFNQHQVNHALKNEEGMFRVVCKRQPSEQSKPYLIKKMVGGFSGRTAIAYPFGEPPYQVGETIFVKEAWSFSDSPWNDKTIFYKASNSDFIQHTFSVSRKEKKWRSPVTMHEEYSRLTLRIKSVKVERLADISEEDAIKEGVYKSEKPNPFSGRNYRAFECNNFLELEHSWHYTAQHAFAEFWNSTHKKPEKKWEANPFVFCFSYEVVR